MDEKVAREKAALEARRAKYGGVSSQALGRSHLRSERLPAHPDHEMWSQMERVKLWEAVALTCGLNPDAVPPEQIDYLAQTPALLEFRKRLRVAERASRLKLYGRMDKPDVRMDDFVSWVHNVVRWQPLPEWFPPPPQKAVEQERGSSNRWPWGTYETDLLRHLAAAAKEHWSTYDSNEPSTAPKNVVVEAWLQERGVVQKNAEIIARILRADGLPVGPRANRRTKRSNG